MEWGYGGWRERDDNDELGNKHKSWIGFIKIIIRHFIIAHEAGSKGATWPKDKGALCSFLLELSLPSRHSGTAGQPWDSCGTVGLTEQRKEVCA